MKNRIFSLIMMATCACTMAMAQLVQEDELAVVYYMPQTQVAVIVDYDKVTVTPGPFYLYAERYLGVKDVTTEASTRYEVTNIRLATHTVADLNRAYKVVNETPWLSLTSEGLLYGYNVPAPVEATPTTATTPTAPAATACPLMPLMEEQMVASSIAKMAEGAAKQIYHIREMRMNLLAGDVEHTPADGLAMQLVLSELDKREQMLAELFIGTRIVESYSHTLRYVPSEDVTGHVIGRVSQYTGIVPADDLSGEPIRLTLSGNRQAYMPIEDKSEKTKELPSQIYYNLPGSAKVHVDFGQDLHTSACMAVAQFGVAVPLSKSLLLGKKTPQIYFNTVTGNILSIIQ